MKDVAAESDASSLYWFKPAGLGQHPLSVYMLSTFAARLSMVARKFNIQEASYASQCMAQRRIPANPFKPF